MKTKKISKVFSVVTPLVIIFLSAEFALALQETSDENLSFSPEVLKQEAQNCMQKKDYLMYWNSLFQQAKKHMFFEQLIKEEIFAQ